MLSCCFKESNEDITLNLSCQHEIGVLSILTFSVTEKSLLQEVYSGICTLQTVKFSSCFVLQ